MKLILANPLAPGDILMSTSAIRDLHKAYPGEYVTDIRCPTGCEQIFYNNPSTGTPWTIAELDDLLAGITLGKGGGFGIPYCDCLRVIVLWANAKARTDFPLTLDEDQVRLNGHVVEDEAEECQVYFEYGPDNSYGSTTTPETKVKGDSFHADITMDAPVHFRAVIETPCGETFYGSDRLWTGRGASGRSVADKLVAKGAI
jgi:hypothetical protein